MKKREALISKAAAARLLGVSRAAVSQWGKKPFMVTVDGVEKIDTSHPAWQRLVSSPKAARTRRKKQESMARRGNSGCDPFGKENISASSHAGPVPSVSIPGTDDLSNLVAAAQQAELQEQIYDAAIKRERAAQEEIKTAEIKKDLAPMYLLKHFFAFGESMIHRSFRRFHEIMPELTALIQGGRTTEAEQLLTREMETIVQDSQADLIRAIEDEGFPSPGPSPAPGSVKAPRASRTRTGGKL